MCLYRVIASHLLFSLNQAWYVWLSQSLPEIDVSSSLIHVSDLSMVLCRGMQYSSTMKIMIAAFPPQVSSCFNCCLNTYSLSFAMWWSMICPWAGCVLDNVPCAPKHTEQLYYVYYVRRLFRSMVHCYKWCLNKILWKTNQRSSPNPTWNNRINSLSLQRFLSQAPTVTFQILLSSNCFVNSCLFLGTNCSFILD